MSRVQWIALVALVTVSSAASTFTSALGLSNVIAVTTTADSGPGSLRSAIAAANQVSGVTITFHIGPWGSQQTITALSALPPLKPLGGITIDGRTQSGSTKATSPPLIRITNGAGAMATPTSIPGLQLGDQDAAIDLDITGFGNGVTLQGTSRAADCWLGIDQSATAAPNYVGLYGAPGLNSRGFGSATSNNVASGNVYYGVELAAGANGYALTGNRIGTDPSGSYAIPNGSGRQPPYGGGVLIGNLGNASLRTTDELRGNVISGNAGDGVDEFGYLYGTDIYANYIGTNGVGSAAIPNQADGVDIGSFSVSGNGPTDIDLNYNVISGNLQSGLSIFGASTAKILIVRNEIGTNGSATNTYVTPTMAIPNGRFGVHINQGAHDNVVLHNFIGGNLVGVGLSGPSGMGAGSGNIISGNDIGTNQTGANLGNIMFGVYVSNSAGGQLIGAGSTYPPDIVAYNGAAGVAIDSSNGETVSQDSIYGNGAGITLTNGANHSIAAPDIASVVIGTGYLSVAGTAPSGPMTVEVFLNRDCSDPEGKTFLGSTSTTTGAFPFVYSASVPSGMGITATATNTSAGDTSQFSSCTLTP